MSWVWDHFTKKDGKAVCKVAKANGEPCNQQLEWKKSTTSLSYHLTNVHGLEKGSAGPQHKRMKFSSVVVDALMFVRMNLRPLGYLTF